MATPTNKRRSVISFNNLPLEIQEAVKAFYPYGYSEAMMRINKPNGDFFFAVPFETDEVSYLVKIDDPTEEDDDKEYYDDEIKGADQIQDDEEEEEERRPSPIEFDDED